MKLSALAFTSGLGQVIEGPIESPPSDLTSTSSSSGELQRELWVLRILTKSPRATNLTSAILNCGGGGGGSGIRGEGGAMMTLGFVGFGGFPVLSGRRRGASAGGLVETFLKRLCFKIVLRIDDGGGRGGGGGGAVVE